MGLAINMFEGIDNDEGVLQAFLRVVSTRILPKGRKQQHDGQSWCLERIMGIWAEDGRYDMELDPFLQYLRVNIGQGTLSELMVSLVREEDAERARQGVGLLTALPMNMKLVHARDLPAEVKQSLRVLKGSMEAKRAYNSAIHSIPAGSSGESSDESDVEEEYEL
jgi:hypothetical protein